MFLITQLTMEHMNQKIILHLNCQLSTYGNTFYQSWFQPTYNRMHVSEILSLAEYMLIHVYDVIGHCQWRI